MQQYGLAIGNTIVHLGHGYAPGGFWLRTRDCINSDKIGAVEGLVQTNVR
jgi:hypothetical protein